MITGSHNPPEFHGFKMVCGTCTIHGEAIQEIRCTIETGDLARREGSHRTADCATAYIEEISSQFSLLPPHSSGVRRRQRRGRPTSAM
jgi:phosphomannomutase